MGLVQCNYETTPFIEKKKQPLQVFTEVQDGVPSNIKKNNVIKLSTIICLIRKGEDHFKQWHLSNDVYYHERNIPLLIVTYSHVFFPKNERD